MLGSYIRAYFTLNALHNMPDLVGLCFSNKFKNDIDKSITNFFSRILIKKNYFFFQVNFDEK